MIFTVGKASVYDPYLTSDPDAAKRKGGSVWQTREEAQVWADMNPGYKVYGVEADWMRDTISKGDYFHDLTRNAKLISLSS